MKSYLCHSAFIRHCQNTLSLTHISQLQLCEVVWLLCSWTWVYLWPLSPTVVIYIVCLTILVITSSLVFRPPGHFIVPQEKLEGLIWEVTWPTCDMCILSMWKGEIEHGLAKGQSLTGCCLSWWAEKESFKAYKLLKCSHLRLQRQKVMPG